jgi:hypothetical protein
VVSSEVGSTVAPERVGLFLHGRLSPPRETFGSLAPDRILFGHGTGVFDAADEAPSTALDDASRGPSSNAGRSRFARSWGRCTTDRRSVVFTP